LAGADLFVVRWRDTAEKGADCYGVGQSA